MGLGSKLNEMTIFRSTVKEFVSIIRDSSHIRTILKQYGTTVMDDHLIKISMH